MTWNVEGTNEFEEWFVSLDDTDRARIEDRVDLLAEVGPALGRPAVDTIRDSRHRNMKELRSGKIRVLFIFDPRSTAILLLGGNKQDNWVGWYEQAVPAADTLYDTYLHELAVERKETSDADQEVQ